MGQKREALRTLHDVLSNNRKKFHWQKPFEDVMTLCVELCVELRKGKTAKDALIQYRQLCQNTNMNSLELIIRKYLDLARLKSEEAQEKTNQVITDIEDLDEEESPESLIVQVLFFVFFPRFSWMDVCTYPHQFSVCHPTPERQRRGLQGAC